MPYTQEQYERAKQSLTDPGLPEASRKIRTQRIAEFESDQARGYMREQGSSPPQQSKPISLPVTRPDKSWSAEEEMATDEATAGALGGMDSWLLNSSSDTADLIRSGMSPEALEAKRKATDFAKKLARDEKLPTASKLKVFNAPPKYEPPPPLSSMPFTSKLNPMERYFEPTLDEFKSIALSDGRFGQHIRRQFPDIQKLEELPDEKLEESEAFKAYADARWQTALADAIKTKTPIVRVAFESPEGADGERPQSMMANFMDGTMALGASALQGKSMGLYDLGLSGLAAADRAQNAITGREDASQFEKFRDAQRGSMERHPVLSTIGSVAGAMDPRGLPGRLTGGLSKLGNPKSLLGRMGKAGAVGAASAVIDENARAAANLAADALDAEMTATEAASHLMQNLPGFRPGTVALGGSMGAAGDLIGAGASKASAGIQNMDHLRAPLERARRSGVTLGAMGDPKVPKGASDLEFRAASNRTTPSQQVAEDIASPLATQRLMEQEAATRSDLGETALAQIGLENARLPTHEAGKRIRAITAGPAITRMAESSKRVVNEIAGRLMGRGRVSAEELDTFIQQVDQAAGFDKARGKPSPALAAVSKELKELRDNFAGMEDPTIVDGPDGQPTLAEPRPEPIAGLRDAEGNVKATEGYSALKTRQSKMRRFHGDMNEMMGLPRELTAEPVVTERVNKGLFNTETPEELVKRQAPEVRLSPNEVRAFGQAIGNANGLDNSNTRKLVKDLAERAGPKLLAKVEHLEQLLDAGDIKRALGRGMEGINLRTEGVAGILRREQLLRLVPTLESLSGGLPRAPRSEATELAVKRFGEFIPVLKAAAMRGGAPARGVGAYERRDEQPKGMPKFSDEEAEFWLKVVDKLSGEMKPQ